MTKINDSEEKLNIDEIEEVAGGKVQALVSGDGREPQPGVLSDGASIPPVIDPGPVKPVGQIR